MGQLTTHVYRQGTVWYKSSYCTLFDEYDEDDNAISFVSPVFNCLSQFYIPGLDLWQLLGLSGYLSEKSNFTFGDSLDVQVRCSEDKSKIKTVIIYSERQKGTCDLDVKTLSTSDPMCWL